MNPTELEQLAERLLAGELSHEAFVSSVSSAQMASLSHSTLDLDRKRRCGFPEVVFGQGKSVEQLEQITRRLLATDIDVLATRVSSQQARARALGKHALRVDFHFNLATTHCA